MHKKELCEIFLDIHKSYKSLDREYKLATVV